MGTDTKKLANVGGGWTGRKIVGKIVQFKTGLLNQDSTGMTVVHKTNQSSINVRKETADTLVRRKQGYRGL
jgi:hypothetical protein